MEKHQKNPTLVVRLGGLGDVIMTLGLIKKLQEHRPIIFLTHQDYKSLIDHLDLPNVSVIYTRYALSKKASLRQLFKGLIKNISLLAFRSFDEVYLCYQDRRYRLILGMSFYKKVIFLPKHRIENSYLGDEILNMGAFDHFELPKIKILKDKKNEKKIVLFPGGDPSKEVGKILRMWPLENFVSLAKLLLEKGYEVWISGSDYDRYILKDFKGLNLNSFFSSDLAQTIKFLSSAQYVVTPDSGPFHLSLFTDAVIIPLFGPTQIKERIPHQLIKTRIKIPKPSFSLSCSPCYKNAYQFSCKRALCMELIRPAHVLEVIVPQDASC